jgi:hypothetical protein
VARRRLGTALRRLREDANIRIDAAARELECSPAKISRLENGQGPAKLWDVRILADFYGLQDPVIRKRLESWARGTKDESWWESDADLMSDDVDRYFAAETQAARVRMYCTPVLPAILQTQEYATAHMRVLHPDWSDVDVARFVDARRARQAPLLREADPLQFEAVIDEAAVLRRLGSAEVHAAQLEWLVELLDDLAHRGRTNLVVRIVPLSAGPGRALCPITIFEPRSLQLDPVEAYVEDRPDWGHWLESGGVAEAVDLYESMLALSEEPGLSLTNLRSIARSVREAAGPRPAPVHITER